MNDSTNDDQVQAELQAQRQKVASILASKREMLHSPQGLMGLFPTNRMRVKLTTTTAKRKEAEERKAARERQP